MGREQLCVYFENKPIDVWHGFFRLLYKMFLPGGGLVKQT